MSIVRTRHDVSKHVADEPIATVKSSLRVKPLAESRAAQGHARHMRSAEPADGNEAGEQTRYSAQRARRPRRIRRLGSRAAALLVLALATVASVLMYANFANATPDKYNQPTQGVSSREADPRTMDGYIDQLLGGTYRDGTTNQNEGSRYAGRIWSDKTVIANELTDSGGGKGVSFTLDAETDGIGSAAENVKTITTNEDFLHVYSALGSSQLENEKYSIPMDVVIVLDLSGSMGTGSTGNGKSLDNLANSRIQQTLTAVNNAIQTLMEANPNNRIGIAVYGSAGTVFLPLVSFQPKAEGQDLDWVTLSPFNPNGTTAENARQYITEYGGTTYTKNGGNYLLKLNMGANAALVNSTGNLKSNDKWDNYQYKSLSQVVQDIKNAEGDSGHEYVGNFMPGAKPTWPEEAASSNSGVALGYSTNIQSGIAAGMKLLAETDVTTWTSELTHAQYDRQPVVLLMTDGQPNTISNSQNSSYSKTNTIAANDVETSWYNPLIGSSNGEFNYNNQTAQAVPAVITESVMTGSFYKSAIANNYNDPDKRVGDTDIAPLVYGIGVDMDSTLNPTGTSANRKIPNAALVFGIMDPKYWFNATGTYTGPTDNPYYKTTDGSGEVTYTVPVSEFSGKLTLNDTDLMGTAYTTYYQAWVNGSGDVPTEPIPWNTLSDDSLTGCTKAYAQFGQLPGEDAPYDITRDQVKSNINYVNTFLLVEGANMSDVFSNIIDDLDGEVFTPLEGENDLGADGYLSYIDPLGEGMEIKKPYSLGETDSATRDMQMVLNGNVYGIVQSAVYDYQWNNAFITSGGESLTGTNFIPGWYKNTDNPADSVCYYDESSYEGEPSGVYQNNGKLEKVNSETGLPEGCTTVKEAWKSYTYRLNYSQIQDFVPSLVETESVNALGDKQRNTVYTVFRIDTKNGTTLPESDRRALIQNPSYGQAHNLEDDDPGTYHLSDIRIWEEYTGDWQDEYTGDIVGDAGYDDALYVDIPENALPLQTATITTTQPEIESKARTYATNLGFLNPKGTGEPDKPGYISQADYYAQSTPFRLFYSVGIQDDLLYDSGNVDIASLENSFIDTHTQSDGSIWFLSNFWGTNTTAGSSLLASNPMNLFVQKTGESFTAHTGYTIPQDSTVVYYLVDSDPSLQLSYFTPATTPATVVSTLQANCMEDPESELTGIESAAALLGNANAGQYLVAVAYTADPNEEGSGATLVSGTSCVIPSSDTAIGTLNVTVQPSGSVVGDVPYDDAENEVLAFYFVDANAVVDNQISSWNTGTTAAQVKQYLGGVEAIPENMLQAQLRNPENNGKMLYVVQYSGDPTSNDQVTVFAAGSALVQVNAPGAAVQGSSEEGNPATTFSPSELNRFYVFQKNLPLYEVPSSTVETIGGGSKLPSFVLPSKGGSSTVVDGEEPVTSISLTDYEKLKFSYNNVDAECKVVNQVEYDDQGPVKEGDGGTLTTDGWYYIIVEYFEPKIVEEDGVKTTYADLKRMAVPREGGQFGTDIAGGNVHFGEYLCWSTKSTTDESGWVTPGQWVADIGSMVDVDGKEQFQLNQNPGGDDATGLVVTTDIGGLRVGNLEGEREAKENNTTQSAQYYYYPSISNTVNTDDGGDGGEGDEDAGGGDGHGSAANLVIDSHLGNNGRETLANTDVLVTKLVYDDDGNLVPPSEGPAKPFQFQTYIEDFEGTRSAIVVDYDEFSGLWRQRIKTIDAVTLNGGGLLVASDGLSAAQVYYSGATSTNPSAGGEGSFQYVDGSQISTTSGEEGAFYIYVESEPGTSSASVPVYIAADSDTEGAQDGGRTVYVENQTQANELNANSPATIRYAARDSDHPVGTRVFWTGGGEVDAEVYLVPTSWVEDPANFSTSNLKDEEGTGKGLSDCVRVNRLQVATLTIDQDLGLRSGVNVTSPYSIKTNFLTRDVTFGLNKASDLYDPNTLVSVRDGGHDSTTAQDMYSHTAQFTLKNGEGLLFQGAATQANFRITEAMDEATADAFELQQARVVQSVNYVTYVPSDGDEGLVKCSTTNPATEGYVGNDAQDPAGRGSAQVEEIRQFTRVQDAQGAYTGALTDLRPPNPYVANNAAFFGLNTGSAVSDEDDLEFYSTFSDTANFEKGGQYENTWYNGELTLTKRAAGMDDATATYDFTATFTTPGNEPYTKPVSYAISAGYGTVKGGTEATPTNPQPGGAVGGKTFYNPVENGSVTPGTGDEGASTGVIEFTLSADQTISFLDLPDGTQVKLEETGGANPTWKQISPPTTEEVNPEDLVIEATQTIELEALNTPAGSLAVSKNVPATGFEEQQFSFTAAFWDDAQSTNLFEGTASYEIVGTGTVTNVDGGPTVDSTSDNDENPLTGTVTFGGEGKNQVAFTLTPDSTIVFYDFKSPAGGSGTAKYPMYYTVTETNEGLAGNWQSEWVVETDTTEETTKATVNNENLSVSGKVAGTDRISLIANNTPPATLNVTKVMAAGQTVTAPFGFTATFTDAEDQPYTGKVNFTIVPATDDTQSAIVSSEPADETSPGEPVPSEPDNEGESDDEGDSGPVLTGTLDLSQTNGIVTFNLMPNATVTFTGMPLGSNYRVDEVNSRGFTPTWQNQSGVFSAPNNVNVTATATNHTPSAPRTSTLSVTKEVVDSSQAPNGNQYPITVTLYRDAAMTQPATDVDGTYGAGMAASFVDGQAQFTLKAGQTVRWTDLPEGLYFDATESDSMGYSPQWQRTGTEGLTEGPTITGRLSDSVELVCTNVRTDQRKVETDPGDGEAVGIGQEITYEISYENTTDAPASVTIVDPIDRGLDLVSASIPRAGAGASASTLTLEGAESGSVERDGYAISYEAGASLPEGCSVDYPYAGIVTWTIPNVPAGGTGKVTLTAQVNAQAAVRLLVDDKAFVSWDNGESWTPTEEPENPLTAISLEKVLLDEEPEVASFDFTITLKPPAGEEALTASVPVAFDPASETTTLDFQGGVASFTLAPDQSVTFYGLPVGSTYTYEEVSPEGYDIVWVSGQTGTVYADTTAYSAYTCENVGPGQHKVEADPGDTRPVEVGQEITYRIFWENDSGAEQEVTIVDPLDVGLDFVSATIPNPSGQGQGLTLEAPATVAAGSGALQGYSIGYDTDGLLPGGNSVDYEWAGLVTWSLGTQPAGASGWVELTARVNEDAEVLDVVKDQAFVGWGNQWFITEEPENPLGGPHKVETDPGDGEGVEVGQTITYRIDYQNTTLDPADVTIVDPLDSGADFVSASFPSNDGTNLTLVAPARSFSGEGEYAGYAISWDPAGALPEGCEFAKPYDFEGTVTWTIPSVAPGATGSVYLTVVVNEDAMQDFLIDDQAFVKVGNGPWQPTEEPENPLDENPHKTEIAPGDGERVEVGDEITYRIDWVNDAVDPETGLPMAAEVTIVDPLDVGVDFVSASDGGAYDANGALPAGCAVDYAWHGTVTWSLGEQPAGSSGSVTLTVRVNEGALAAGIVKDQAFVGVDNVWTPTEEPENPLDMPSKREVAPGDGEGVSVGDQIVYEIGYFNAGSEPADVHIVDPLDIGVDFVSASDGGAYDEAGTLPAGCAVDYVWKGVVSWTIPQVPAGTGGTVTLTVRVVDAATEAMVVKDQAFVQIGNGPWKPTDEPVNPLEPGGPGGPGGPGENLPQTGDPTPPLWLGYLLAAAGVAFLAAACLLLRSNPREGPPRL